MDLGLVGIEGLVAGLGQNTATAGFLSLRSENPKCSESGSLKRERADPVDDEGYRASKKPTRVDDFGFKSNEQMLSFSSLATPEFSFLTGKEMGLIEGKSAQSISLSYYQQSAYPKCSAGFESGNLNGGIHGSLTGIKGTFTPAQWIELENQAMIYRYISANVPVPAHLLIPIRKALSSAGFPGFSVGSYPTHSYGWGSFHLGFGFSGSTDPEPGRCRRTDGKKWRCSRDAVPDQKYCEKHINRGRHRSRKPVEGQTGQAATGSTTSSKVSSAISTTLPPFMTSSGGVSSSISVAERQIKGLQPTGAINSTTAPRINRLNDPQGFSMMHPTINLKSDDPPFSIPKQHGDSLQSEFGLVSNDSLLNLPEKRSYLSCKSYDSLLEFDSQQVQQQEGTLTPLMIERPKDQSNRAGVHWPQELKSDWTLLSMSNPMLSEM